LDVALLSVDDLIGQTLSNGLVGLHSVLPGALGNQVDGLIDSSQGRHVDSLLPHNTTSTDTGRVFSGTSLQDSSYEDFEGVPGSEEVNDFEGVADNTDGLDLLTGVASVELHGADEAFDDGAESFSEFLGLVATGGVGDKDLSLGGLGCDVINEAGVFDLGVVVGTLMSS
jgi:hypothetical protein